MYVLDVFYDADASHHSLFVDVQAGTTGVKQVHGKLLAGACAQNPRQGEL